MLWHCLLFKNKINKNVQIRRRNEIMYLSSIHDLTHTSFLTLCNTEGLGSITTSISYVLIELLVNST